MAWPLLPELSKIPASSEKVASGIPDPDPISDRVRVSWAASVTVNDAVGGRSSRRIITAGLWWWWISGVAEVHCVIGWPEAGWRLWWCCCGLLGQVHVGSRRCSHLHRWPRGLACSFSDAGGLWWRCPAAPFGHPFFGQAQVRCWQLAKSNARSRL